jgi:hypothetical protein
MHGYGKFILTFVVLNGLGFFLSTLFALSYFCGLPECLVSSALTSGCLPDLPSQCVPGGCQVYNTCRLRRGLKSDGALTIQGRFLDSSGSFLR